jgi:hypothetical protein
LADTPLAKTLLPLANSRSISLALSLSLSLSLSFHRRFFAHTKYTQFFLIIPSSRFSNQPNFLAADPPLSLATTSNPFEDPVRPDEEELACSSRSVFQGFFFFFFWRFFFKSGESFFSRHISLKNLIKKTRQIPSSVPAG